MRISDWSSDVCSSDLFEDLERIEQHPGRVEQHIADPAAEDDADRRVKDEIVGMALGHRRAGLFEQLEQIPPADEDAADIGERIPAQDRVPANREQNGIEAEVGPRSEEHTSELQSLMRTSYAVFCLKKKKKKH